MCKAPPRSRFTIDLHAFHNGIAATLEEVVRFYERNLGFAFTDAERADLVAFLNAL